MNFLRFKNAIERLVMKGSARPPKAIKYEYEGNKYFAYYGGIKFIGNDATTKITARWGDGHQAMFDVATV